MSGNMRTQINWAAKVSKAVVNRPMLLRMATQPKGHVKNT